MNNFGERGIAMFKHRWPKLCSRAGVLGASLLVAGCGGAYWNSQYDGKPETAIYQVSPQNMLASAKHWRIVADDIASQIAKISKSSDVKVFVPEAKDSASQFSKVFTSQLRSSLFGAGVNLTSSEASGQKVVVKIDAVKFVEVSKYAPGSLTALGAGVLVVRDLALNGDGVGAFAAAVVGTDVAKSIVSENKRPLTEIVLTTAIEQNGKYIHHTTDTYYVEGGDICLYKEPEDLHYNFSGNGKRPACGYYLKK